METNAFIPYGGKEPYVFISYSHQDKGKASQIMQIMSDAGILFWFDKGIDPGSEWDENIALHVENCGCMVALVSKNYLQSENCRDELKFARDQKKDILVVYIENCSLPSGIALRLNRRQAINMYMYDDMREFRKELISAKVLAPYLSFASQRNMDIEDIETEKKDSLPVPQTIVDENEFQIGVLLDSSHTALGLTEGQLIGKTLIYDAGYASTDAFINQLILNLYQKGISFIVISSNGKRYRNLLNYVPDLQLFTPGKPEGIRFPYNPLALDTREHRNHISWLARVGYCFQEVLGLSTHAQTLFMMAIRTSYTLDARNHEYEKIPGERTVFQFRDVLNRYQQLVQESKFSPEEKELLLEEGRNKLQAILEESKSVLDQTYCVSANDLLKAPSVIELDGIESPEIQSLLGQLLLNQLYAFCRTEALSQTGMDAISMPPHMSNVIILDDIDLLWSSETMSGREAYQRRISIMRVLKEIESLRSIGIVGIMGSMGGVSQTLMQSFHTKVILPGGEPMKTEEVEYLLGNRGNYAALTSPQAIVIKKGVVKPVVFEPNLLDNLFSSDISDKDAAARVWYWLDKEEALARFPECWDCFFCKSSCDLFIQAEAERTASRLFYRDARKITTTKQMKEYLSSGRLSALCDHGPLPLYKQVQLYYCTRIHLYNEFYLRNLMKLNPDDVIPNRIPLIALKKHETFSLGHFPIGYNPNNEQDFELTYIDFTSHLFYLANFRHIKLPRTVHTIEKMIRGISQAEHAMIKVIDGTKEVFLQEQLPTNICIEQTEDDCLTTLQKVGQQIKASFAAEGNDVRTDESMHDEIGEAKCYVHIIIASEMSFQEREKLGSFARQKVNPIFDHHTILLCSRMPFGDESFPEEQTIFFTPDELPLVISRRMRKYNMEFDGFTVDRSGTKKPFVLFD